MTDSRMAKNIKRWRVAVASHDSYNPTHTSYGIGLSHFDIERLGLEEGEEIWDGYRIYVDGKTSGNFRVLCDGEHDDCAPKTLEEKEAGEVELVEAVGEEIHA